MMREHVLYALKNAPMREYPFPHFFCPEVFPPDFYRELMRCLPPRENYATAQNSYGYHGRKFNDDYHELGLGFMDSRDFALGVMSCFEKHIHERFKGVKVKMRAETRLIMDAENYHIGPHTDAPWKIVSLLFYLPSDESLKDLGTSIYLPNETGRRCKGGPHYKFEEFTEIFRAPFVPNSCLGFWKTDDSWHGVAPITRACRRDVLLFNLYAVGEEK